MDRAGWLRERRRATETRYDTVYAPTYDHDDEPTTAMHRAFVRRVVEAAPAGGVILDAPCGTGKYFDLILDAGRAVVGVDQSAGMLAQAGVKHPSANLRKGGLQELAFDAAFDGVICVDSMENVPPEDWPLVLGNLRRALRVDGLLYVTVEEIDRAEVERALEDARATGVPLVLGETGRGGGYHHYPERPQVRAWIEGAGLAVLEEGETAASTYGYWHLLLGLPARGAGYAGVQAEMSHR